MGDHFQEMGVRDLGLAIDFTPVAHSKADVHERRVWVQSENMVSWVNSIFAGFLMRDEKPVMTVILMGGDTQA
jgi:hypothetical protein